MFGLFRKRDIEPYMEPEIVQEIGQGRHFTPDIAKLEKYDWQKIFVCDEWMSDRRGSSVFDEAELKYPPVIAFTKNKYNFLIHSETGAALPVPSEDGYQIKGEILVIRPWLIWKTLDKLKGNTLHYDRSFVPLLDPARIYLPTVNNGFFTEEGLLLPEMLQGKKNFLGAEQVFDQKAWMYLPNPAYWEYMMKRRPELFDKVPVYKPKKNKEHWLGEYHQYQDPPKDK